MTRINCGIPAEPIDDWRLIAEINEIPRVIETYHGRKLKGINFSDIPRKFKLGTGHVIFFLDKLKYIHNRYFYLLEEFNKRHLREENIPDLKDHLYFKDGDLKHYNDYIPTDYDKQLVVTRIVESIRESESNFVYYEGVQFPKQYGIDRITKIAKPLEIKNNQGKLF